MIKNGDKVIVTDNFQVEDELELGKEYTVSKAHTGARYTSNWLIQLEGVPRSEDQYFKYSRFILVSRYREALAFIDAIPQMKAEQVLLNEATIPGWKDKKLNFARAFYKEAVEIGDHYPWKWWKASEINKEQAFMEVVDMFHFLLSCIILADIEITKDGYTYGVGSCHSMSILEGIRYTDTNPTQERFNAYLDRVVNTGSHLALDYDRFKEYEKSTTFNLLISIVKLTYMLGFTATDLQNWYIGKCALNHFRQQNGYKEGTYKKVWNGMEDNQYLEKIIEEAGHMNKVLTKESVIYCLQGILYSSDIYPK